MAKKRTVFVDVVVDDKGTTKKLAIDSKRLSDGLEKGSKGTKDFDRNLRGVIGTAQAGGRNFAALAQGIAGGIVPVYAAFAAQVFAIGAAFRFLQSAGDLATLEKGQIAYASSTGVALRTLTNRIQEATAGQVAFQDAAQAAAIGTAAGLSADQLERLGGAAKDASIVLGRDVTDSFNRLVRGVTKAEPELLDELGIVLRLKDATDRYAASLGKSANDLTQFEKSQAVANDVLDQAETKYGEIIDIVNPSINQFNAFGKAFDDIVNSIKTGLNALLGPIAEILAKNPFATLLLSAPLLNGFLKVLLPGFEGVGNAATNALEGLGEGLAQAKKNADIEFTSLKLLAGDSQAASEFIKITNDDLVELAANSETGFTGLKKLQGGGELAGRTIKSNLDAAKKATGVFADMPDKVREEYIRMFTDLDVASKVSNGKMQMEFAKGTSFIKLKFAEAKAAAMSFFNSVVAGAKRAVAGLIKNFARIASGIGVASIALSFLPDSFKNLFATLDDPRLRDYLDELKGLNKETEKFVEVQKKLNEDFADTGNTVPIVAQNIAKLSSTISGARYNELLEPLFKAVGSRGLSSIGTGFEDVNQIVEEQIKALRTLSNSIDETSLDESSASAKAYKTEIDKLIKSLEKAAAGQDVFVDVGAFLKAKAGLESFGSTVEAVLKRNRDIQDSFNEAFTKMATKGPYADLLTNLRQQAKAYREIKKDGEESQSANLALSESRVKVNKLLLEVFEAQVEALKQSKQAEIFRSRFGARESALATNRGKQRIARVTQELAAGQKARDLQTEINTIVGATTANNTKLSKEQKDQLTTLINQRDQQLEILNTLQEQATAAFQIKDALQQGLESGLEKNIYDLLIGNEDDLKVAALKVAQTMYDTLAKRLSGMLTDSLMSAIGIESDEQKLKKTYSDIFTEGAGKIKVEIDALATAINREQTRIFGTDPETGASKAGTGIPTTDEKANIINQKGSGDIITQLLDNKSNLNKKLDEIFGSGLDFTIKGFEKLTESVKNGFLNAIGLGGGGKPDPEKVTMTGRPKSDPLKSGSIGDPNDPNKTTANTRGAQKAQKQNEETAQTNAASAEVTSLSAEKMFQSSMNFLRASGYGSPIAGVAETILGSFFGSLGSGGTGTGEGRYGMKARSMSLGGIARGPQAGYPAVLHGTEAVIPMPSGSIPVEMKGSGGGVNNVSVNVNMGDGTTNVQGGEQGAGDLGKVLARAVQEELQKQTRPGGILSPHGSA